MVDNNLSKQNYVNNLLNNYFNLFVVVLVSFLLLMSYFLLLKPKVDETAGAIFENISSHERLLQAEKNKLASLRAAVLAYEQVDAVDLARINGILPSEYNKEVLFGEIEEIIKQNGFIPTSITLVKEGEIDVSGASSNNTQATSTILSPKVGTVDINLNIAAIDYAGMKNLLSILENNLRILDVKQLTLSNGGSASLELITYYYKK